MYRCRKSRKKGACILDAVEAIASPHMDDMSDTYLCGMSKVRSIEIRDVRLHYTSLGAVVSPLDLLAGKKELFENEF